MCDAMVDTPIGAAIVPAEPGMWFVHEIRVGMPRVLKVA